MNKSLVTCPRGWIEDGPGFNASKAITTNYFPPGPVPIPDKDDDDIPKPKPNWNPVI